MLGGVALIGLLAGSLAEFFERTPAPTTTDGSEPKAAEDPVAAELSALRAEIAELRSLLTPDPPTT
jgi:hypothetical protein